MRPAEVIAPAIGGVTLDDGTTLEAQQMVGGGPSVLYDAVAVVVSDDGAGQLAASPAARDFVTDAHAHAKVIGHSPAATALFEAAGITELDGGYVPLADAGNAKALVSACRALRYWERVGAESG